MSRDSLLRAKARALIQTGNLPNRLPDRKWGGPGIGAPCMVCGAPVNHDEIGLEVEFTCGDGTGASNHHFHVRCFSALELELHKLEFARRTISGSDQVQSATAASMADGRQKDAQP
jgi:hypothetical protein